MSNEEFTLVGGPADGRTCVPPERDLHGFTMAYGPTVAVTRYHLREDGGMGPSRREIPIRRGRYERVSKEYMVWNPRRLEKSQHVPLAYVADVAGDLMLELEMLGAHRASMELHVKHNNDTNMCKVIVVAWQPGDWNQETTGPRP